MLSASWGVPDAKTRFCGVLARFHTNPYLGQKAGTKMGPRSGPVTDLGPKYGFVKTGQDAQKRIWVPVTPKLRIKSGVYCGSGSLYQALAPNARSKAPQGGAAARRRGAVPGHRVAAQRRLAVQRRDVEVRDRVMRAV
jgi:hypothetical protein